MWMDFSAVLLSIAPGLWLPKLMDELFTFHNILVWNSHFIDSFLSIILSLLLFFFFNMWRKIFINIDILLHLSVTSSFECSDQTSSPNRSVILLGWGWLWAWSVSHQGFNTIVNAETSRTRRNSRDSHFFIMKTKRSHFNFPICHMPNADWNYPECKLGESMALACLEGSKSAGSLSNKLQEWWLR